MAELDARTTPPWLRPLQLLFLAGMCVAWFDASFHAMERPSFRQYIMGWKMFTMKNKGGTDHRAEVQWKRGEPFEAVELHSYFPARWGSGHRYSRFRDRRRLRMVAGALCHRLEEPAHAVRLYQQRWTLEPGSVKRKALRDELMAQHRCDRPVKMLGNRTMPLHPRLAEQEAQ